MEKSISLSQELNTPVSPYSDGIRLHLPDVTELENLPAKGKITFEYTRSRVSLEGKEKLSAELVLSSITDIEASEDDENGDDSVDKLFNEAADADAGDDDGKE